MDILSLHNYYQQPGGEDQVFAAEASLLREYGHHVVYYTKHNDQIAGMKGLDLARSALWNSAVYRELRSLIRQTRPHVMHLHNTFPLISPAAYYAARAEGIPVVQTLHNYRLLCLNALLFRDGCVCEDCVGRLGPWPGVLHACYRGSRMASVGVVAMLVFHRLLGTWRNAIGTYIALAKAARLKFIEGGLPANKIVVKPNFLHPAPELAEEKGEFGLVVARLSAEKGLDALLQAWTCVPRIPLRIVGDGPLMHQVNGFVREHQLDQVQLLGRRPRAEVFELMKRARFLIFPSKCYESFPIVIVESFACGTPVIASRLGAASEIVKDGRTGVFFSPGDVGDLAAKVEQMWKNPQIAAQMGRQARREFELKYTGARNYELLMGIYRHATRSA